LISALLLVAVSAALPQVLHWCQRQRVDQLSIHYVAVPGTGAGKSTLIKILTAELKPQEGTVTRHPNLRVAYVAQHAFHHLEVGPPAYILTRRQGLVGFMRKNK
jgi:ABC-type ATPase involved in cell division